MTSASAPLRRPQFSSIADYIAYQQQNLINAFNGPASGWSPHAVMASGYRSFADGEAQIAMRDKHYGLESHWLQLGRRNVNNVRIFVDGMTDGGWELWTRVGYRDYRSAFQAFVALFGLDEPLNQRYDVDHMFARSRMRNVETGVVRLTLTDSAINRSWGTWLERLEVGWHSQKVRHAARAVQVAKAIGVLPPSGSIKWADVNALHAELCDRGMNNLELDELMGNFTMASAE